MIAKTETTAASKSKFVVVTFIGFELF
jgi:hypothetical protein